MTEDMRAQSETGVAAHIPPAGQGEVASFVDDDPVITRDAVAPV